MKILAIGDTHFKPDNVIESYDFIKKLENYISNNIENIDIIVVLGDILHTHEKVFTQALNVALDFFKMLIKYKSKNVFVLVGNHDMTSNTNFLNDSHWMNSLKAWGTLTIIDKTFKHILNNNEFIVLCPYVPDGRFIEALNTVKDWKEARIIFGHQSINGGKMGAIYVENVEEWDKKFPLLVSGHLHEKQWVNNNVYYVGSSQQHAFGEGEDKTIALINTKTLKVEEIDLELTTKKIIYLDSNDLEEKLPDIKVKANEQIKLVVSGDYNFFKEFKKTEQLKKKLLAKGISKVVFKQKEIKIKENTKLENKEGLDPSKPVSNDFYELLDYMIKEENNEDLTKLYKSFIK